MERWIGWVGAGLVLMGAAIAARLPKAGGMIAALRRLAVSACCLGLGVLCLALALALRSFEAFAGSRPVAEVRCRWTGPKEFELSYVSLRGGVAAAQPRVFRLRGDQWSISGGVIKWHPWLTALGLPSYHRPGRVSGRFSRLEDETAAAPSAYDLDGEFDRVWWWFYRLDPALPFVQAVYGSAAFTFVNPAVRHILEVTPSGYLIRQERAEQPASSVPCGTAGA